MRLPPAELAAIYARFSSDNQREESIVDQIASCRAWAGTNGVTVLDAHIYSDSAQSGASHDRAGLLALKAAAEQGQFGVVIVDDLSRLARDNAYMLGLLSDFRYLGVRLVAVADHLDTSDEEATFLIQIRGAINQLFIRDLSKKTLRGQLGQKKRGYFVGEKTFGYSSRPHGAVRVDKAGRPRPEGYTMHVEPSQAAIIVRIFKEYVAGTSVRGVVAQLNKDGVPPPARSRNGWRPSTVHRILRNEKYIARWVWNRTERRRDPRSGRCRAVPKPQDVHIVLVDESLRIVPQSLWDAARERGKQVTKVFPGGGRRGFTKCQGPRSQVYPAHLFSGMLRCACCDSPISLVGGKKGGFYGCSAAVRSVCENGLTVKRSKVERILLAAVGDRLLEPGTVRHALRRVGDELAKLSGDVADMCGRKEAELADAQKRVDHLVEFVALGKAFQSEAVAKKLAGAEDRAARLQAELDALRSRTGPAFAVPTEEWIAERVAKLQTLLERRTPKSAEVLRRLLGKVVLEVVRPESGKPYYLAHTAIDTLALIEPSGPRGGSDGGSDPLQWWTSAGSNRRPDAAGAVGAGATSADRGRRARTVRRWRRAAGRWPPRRGRLRPRRWPRRARSRRRAVR